MKTAVLAATLAVTGASVVEAGPLSAGQGLTGDVPPSVIQRVQYGGTYAPAPQLREYIDRDGNRVFVDPYGNVVSVVPPAGGGQQSWGSRGDQWGVRQEPQGQQQGWGGDFYPEPPRPDEVYGGRQDYGQDRQVYGDPYGGGGYDRGGYDDFRSYPPLEGSVERRALGEPRPPQDPYGPRPYTPPTLDGAPQAPATVAADAKPEIAALQVFLDRAGISPGVIDGRMGSNVQKALDAYEQKTGERLDPKDSEAIMARLGSGGGLPIRQYTITEDDVNGPFISSVPTDYAEKAELEALSYTSPAELLAEKFHMDEDYLRAINQNADFSVPGTVIKVMDVGSNEKGEVARIVADKARKQVFAYDASGELVAAYPATIGSSATPSPSGTHTVDRIAPNPNYTYNPKINFKQGDNDKVLTIPPGPNGPVGSMWIALSKPTYGIHGTPEPSQIGKTESNGCVRLTNWDAAELAKMVKPGVTVEFVDDGNLVASGANVGIDPATETGTAVETETFIDADALRPRR